jgi:signal recognition particle subunit SRP54
MDPFDLNDFRKQLLTMKNTVSMRDVTSTIRGMHAMEMADFSPSEFDREVKLVQGIIDSMTPSERRDPGLIDLSRRRRIAAGSNTEQAEVSSLITQFQAMAKALTEMRRRRKDL